jgi:hypothetical protein
LTVFVKREAILIFIFGQIINVWCLSLEATAFKYYNRFYRLTPPQNYNIQSIVGAPHLAFEGGMGVRWKGGVREKSKLAMNNDQ